MNADDPRETDLVENTGEDLLTRREALKRSGLVALALGAGPSILAARAFASPVSAETIGGTLYFLSYEGYDLPGPMKAWKHRNHVTVKATYVNTNDDVPAKTLRGNVPYDFTALYHGYTPLWEDLGILEPIDESKIPNLKNLFPFFRSNSGHFWVKPDGTRIGVPFSWGFQAVSYDSSAIPAPSSYDDLLKPEYKGKIAIADDAAGIVTLGCAILGLDPSRMTKADFAKVVDLYTKFVKQTRGISPNYGDVVNRLASGEAVAVIGGFPALNNLAAGAGKKTVKTVLPKEGGFTYTNAWAILKTSKNTDTMLAWINETCRPQIGGAISTFLNDSSTVMGADKYASKVVTSLYPGTIDQLRKKAPLLLLPPAKSTKYVTFKQVIDAWQKIKANA